MSECPLVMILQTLVDQRSRPDSFPKVSCVLLFIASHLVSNLCFAWCCPVCSSLSVRPQQSPFLCLDLVYISVLLQELGFSTDKQLKVRVAPGPETRPGSHQNLTVLCVFQLARTMNHVGLSWSLGAAFHHLNTLTAS